MNNLVIHEVGMRDGLQAENEIVPTEIKIKWIEELYQTGVDIIQVGSFVNPKKMPQMADTDELFKALIDKKNKPSNVILSGLVLNEKGLERGLQCGVEMFCMGVSASDTHSQKNTGMSTLEALDRIIQMARNAISDGKNVQVSVQSAFGCGFEGKIPESRVIGIIEKYLENDIKMISLADTAGHANPEQVEKMFAEIYKLSDDVNCSCHFHDTFGMGLANSYAAYISGVKYFEASFAGLGGCPFTALASGNVCTEDLIHMFQNMDIRKDIKIGILSQLSKQASEFLKRELPGVIYKTGTIPSLN